MNMIDKNQRLETTVTKHTSSIMRTAAGALLFALVVKIPGLGLPQSESAQANVIHVEIEALRNDNGYVFCALFSSRDGFPKENQKAVVRLRSSVSDRKATCVFCGILPGTYAVAVFHDENSNGKLDTKFMGIPREGVGASNDAKGHLGPPKFEAAAFRFSGGVLNLKIRINYL